MTDFRLEPPRFADADAFTLAGLRCRYSFHDVNDGVVRQWGAFARHIGHIPGQIGAVTYGVCYTDQAGSFDYMSAVMAGGDQPLPDGLERAIVPAARYAVFAHVGHVSAIRHTVDAIYRSWLPRSGRQPSGVAGAPDFFERYGEAFDPNNGTGDIEVWLPIKP